MKRYLVFSYNTYYPCGGMHDFLDSIDDLNNLNVLLSNLEDDKFHVWDSLEKRYIIEETYICDYIN